MSLSVAEIQKLLQVEDDSKSIVQRRRDFFNMFYEPAAFLLELKWENLFEPASQDKWYWRCKGCKTKLTRLERLTHFTEHKREYDKIAA